MRKRRTTNKTRRFNRTKKSYPKSGFFKLTRWSNLDSTFNCHVQVNGNDTLPSTDGSTQFAMSNVAGSGELLNLFDNFRIIKVLYRWVITRDPSEYSGATTLAKGLFPRVTWCHDFNSSATLNRTAMLQRANMREFYFTASAQKTRWYTLNPAFLMQGYEGVTTAAYSPKWRQWLDTQDQASPHYGILYNISENYAGNSVRLEAKLVMEFKGVS